MRVLQNAKLSFTLIVCALSVACSSQKPSHIQSNVPQDWYTLPEDQASRTSEFTENSEKLGETVDTILGAYSEALETGMNQTQSLMQNQPSPPPGMPADWVPWRGEVFTADLGISAGGLLGSLIMKGSATIRSYWRRQGPKPADPFNNIMDRTENQDAIVIREDATPQEISEQLEPGIRAAVASGRIEDTPALRKNLMDAAQEFQMVAQAISQTPTDLPWWVPRYRLDVNFDGSGKVGGIGKVGGEVRFRFEWHRIMKSKPKTRASAELASYQNPFERKVSRGVQDFIVATAADLNETFDTIEAHGFKAYTFRVGIGISAKGNIGVVKGSAGLVGQVYFQRAVPRPVVHPRPPRQLALSTQAWNVIEKAPPQAHLSYANAHHIAYESSPHDGFEEVVYKVDRNKFRKGLKRAAKIANFFAKRAVNASIGSWKIYEMRTAFDSSIGGELDLVTLTGSATTQVAFFNQNF